MAENDHQYPKYNADGSIKTKTTNVNFTAKNVIRVTRKGWIPRKSYGCNPGICARSVR